MQNTYFNISPVKHTQLIGKLLLIIVVALLMTGCTNHHGGEVVEVQQTNDVRPFNKFLAKIYKAEYNPMYNQNLKGWGHIPKKRKLANDDRLVMPELVEDYDLDYGYVNEFTEARLRLVNVLNIGGRKLYPEDAASAQVYFDCWIEGDSNTSYKPGNEGRPACRMKFYEKLNALEAWLLPAEADFLPVTSLPPAPAAPEMAAAPAAMPAPPQVREYMIFFDFDKATLTTAAESIVAEVAKIAQETGDLAAIRLVGHTDTAGPENYNLTLSEKRVKAVLNALVQQGVDASRVRTFAVGENELMVPTADNVAEPQNRRVEATIVVKQ